MGSSAQGSDKSGIGFFGNTAPWLGDFSGRAGHFVVVAYVFVGDDDDAASGELSFVGFDYFRDVFGGENGG